MARLVLGVIGGVVAGSILNMAIIMMSWRLYPPPLGADLSEPAALSSYVQSLPLPAFLIVLVAHAGGAFAGGLVAALIARRSQVVVGAIVGAIFLLGGIANVMSIPSPLWFAVVDLVSYVPCGILGASLVRRRN